MSTPFLTKSEGLMLSQYSYREIKKLLYQSGVKMYDTLAQATSAATSLDTGTILQISSQTDAGNAGVYSVTNSGLRYEYGFFGQGVYGVQYDKTVAAPEVQRIGDMSCHASLPVQTKMRRCILNDAGEVVYYLHKNNSTLREDGDPANLDGTDGQVMVEVQEMYMLCESHGNINRILISEHSFPGAIRTAKRYVSAYKATVNRDNDKLSSVASLDPKYRGGSGATNRDDFLGKAASNLSLDTFKNYASNRGEGWVPAWYQIRKDLAWLITIEYGTRHHRLDVNNTLTPEGFRQGGLGDGGAASHLGVDSAVWTNYNGRYSVFNCGVTNQLGNNAGEVMVNVPDFFATGDDLDVGVNSYRGVELMNGDIMEYTDGVVFNVDDDRVRGYVATNREFDLHKFNGRYMGELANTSQYIREVVFGDHGDIFPERVGASATTYFTNYHTTGSPGTRVARFGGYLHSSAYAGSFYSTVNHTPSHAASLIGSRLCFLTE